MHDTYYKKLSVFTEVNILNFIFLKILSFPLCQLILINANKFS